MSASSPLPEVTSKKMVATLSGDSQAIPLSVSSGFQESGISTETAGSSWGMFTVPAGAKLVREREKARAAKKPRRAINRGILFFLRAYILFKSLSFARQPDPMFATFNVVQPVA